MSPFRRLFGYASRYRGAWVLGLACAVVTQAIALVSPKVLQHAIDDLTIGVTRTKLLMYGLALFAIGAVGGVFRFSMRRILMGASRDIEYDMRNEFFAHLQQLPAAYFQAHRTGDLMSRATNDLNAVRMMIGPAVMYAVNTTMTFVVAIALMLSIDARLTLLSLIPLPFVSVTVRFFGIAIQRRFERIQAQLSEISAIAQEALSGVRVVRAYRQERAELERFDQANREYLRRNRRLIALQGLFFPCMSFFLGLGAMLVLWLGSREVIRGRITVGQFVAFNAYLTMLTWPMIAFGWVTNMGQRGMASWKRMLEVLDTTPSIADRGLRIADSEGSAIHGSIEFRDLTFSYGGRPVLRNVTATIAAGQTVALVGPTSAGKSTLIALVARVYDPPPGTVFVDGVDVRDMPLGVLRGSMGFVPQEPFLFSDTLGDNVAFGLDARVSAPPSDPARTAKIRTAAEVARLDKDVVDFPKGYETIVGERGITLSGGQKQRTAIARALAVDPRILILDDALSAVDTYTEEEILSGLVHVMKDRTSVLVSHRISTVRRADMILVLDDGEIVERGTHDELVGRQGLYAQLHQKQLLEEELAAS